MTWVNLMDQIATAAQQTDFNLDVGGVLSVGGGKSTQQVDITSTSGLREVCH